MPGFISLQIPQSGQPNSTEDPKIASDLTTIQTAINGNLDDTNLYSPNNAARKLLLSGALTLSSANTGSTTWILTSDGIGNASNGSAFASNASAPLVWLADSGYTGQPQDFQVAHKAAFVRLRVSVTTGTVAPNVAMSFGLNPITGIANVAGLLSLTLGAPLVAINYTPNVAQQIIGQVSTAAAMPTAAAGYVLAVNSPTPPGGSITSIAMQLYGYNV